MRKCIAVVLSKPNKKYQSEILKGIYKCAFENNMNVAVFASTMKRGSEKYFEGEMKIFTLLNMDKLCGVIYLPDTIEGDNLDELLTKPLVEKARQKNVPLITVDLKIDGILSVCGNDDCMVTSVISHLIEKHNCTDIAYLTGYEGHPHAENRLNAYKTAMLEHGLKPDESRMCYGDFWYNSGADFVDKLMSSEKGLPQAIACANNYMAESVYSYLLSKGIKIPDDILLAGYSEENDKLPFITSAIRNPDKTGYTACTVLLNMMNGKEYKEDTAFSEYDCTVNASVTCGCKSSGQYNYLDGKGMFIDEVGGYFHETNTFNEAMLASDNYTDLLWIVDWSTMYLGNFDDIYFCFCDDWTSYDSNAENHSDYTGEMILYYYRKNRNGVEMEKSLGNELRFHLEDIFPYLNSGEGEPTAYIFRALHFENRCFGYAVISYGNRLETPDDAYDFWLRDVSNAMESQRRTQESKFLYTRMEEIAITDVMTGLLNRNGFNTVMPSFVETAENKGEELAVAMCDMNGLKYINDNFGHNSGDESIVDAAKIMSSIKIQGGEKEMTFRFGGDEYIKVARGYFTPQAVEKLFADVRKKTDDYNKHSGKPYPMYISIGVCVKKADEDWSLDTMIVTADKRMYENKNRLKEETGVSPKR